jgi:hypothetical protein
LSQGGRPGGGSRSTSTRRESTAFGTETTKLAQKTAGDPTKQLAILVDKVIVSSPEVRRHHRRHR